MVTKQNDEGRSENDNVYSGVGTWNGSGDNKIPKE